MNEDLLTIRQMCQRFDVTPRTLRFYEFSEMLFPTRRGQHRLYDRRDCVRMSLILRAKRFGFPLAEIRRLLAMHTPGRQNPAQLEAALDSAQLRLVQLRAEAADLARAVEELEAEIALIESAKTLAEAAA